MPQLTIRSDNEAALRKLQEFLRLFDFEVVEETIESNTPEMPVQYAAKPDFRALAGIWQGRQVDQKALRKDAWGDRL